MHDRPAMMHNPVAGTDDAHTEIRLIVHERERFIQAPHGQEDLPAEAHIRAHQAIELLAVRSVGRAWFESYIVDLSQVIHDPVAKLHQPRTNALIDDRASYAATAPSFALVNLYQLFDPGRAGVGIVIEERHDVAASGSNAFIAACRKVEPGDEAGGEIRLRCEPGVRVILTGCRNDNQLQGPVGLATNRGDGALQRSTAVYRADDDRDPERRLAKLRHAAAPGKGVMRGISTREKSTAPDLVELPTFSYIPAPFENRKPKESAMRRAHGVLFLLLSLLGIGLFQVTRPQPVSVPQALATIDAVGPHGAGNGAAQRAWARLIEVGMPALVPTLAAMSDSRPLAANWLRTVIDTLLDGERAAGRPLPLQTLQGFVQQKHHSGAARQLAYDWLSAHDPATAARLLPEFLHDPAAGLRRAALDDLIRQAEQAADSQQALAFYEQAFAAAADRDQVELLAKRLEKQGHPIDLARRFGFIQNWLLLGPFSNQDGRGYHEVLPPERDFDPIHSHLGKDARSLAWTPCHTADSYGLVDLNKALGKQPFVLAYALAFVDAPAARNVEIRVGCINAVKVFLNGQLLHACEEYHHEMEMDQYRARGTLRPGRNSVLLKVCQDNQPEDFNQHWKFQARICDRLGRPLDLSEEEPPSSPPMRLAHHPVQGTDLQVVVRSVQPRLSTEDWPQFRGPAGTAIAPTAGPVQWNRTQNIAWHAPLPGRGVSSPVVANGRVYVSACSGYQQRTLHILCFAAESGQLLWQRRLSATGSTMCNPKTCMAAPTPVTDGSNAYVLFASGDLVALDETGHVVWMRSLMLDHPEIANQVGLAASPILVDDTLILALDNAGESLALGLDKETGRNRWRVDRPRLINWASPVARRGSQGPEVLFQCWGGLMAHEPRTGRPLWTYYGEGPGSIACPVVSDDLIVVPEGAALRPQGNGTASVAWRSSRLRTTCPSPLAVNGHLYVVTPANVLTCADIPSGKVLWQQRVKGPFSASPVFAAGRLYLVNEDGLTTVVETREEPRILATNDLAEPTLATPAISRGRLYLRADSGLYCINQERQ